MFRVYDKKVNICLKQISTHNNHHALHKTISMVYLTQPLAKLCIYPQTESISTRIVLRRRVYTAVAFIPEKHDNGHMYSKRHHSGWTAGYGRRGDSQTKALP